MRKIKLVLLGLFFFNINFVKAQLGIQYNRSFSELYLYQNTKDGIRYTDTLTLLNMFKEYSFHIDRDALYVCWASFSKTGKKIYEIDCYKIVQMKISNVEYSREIYFQKFKNLEKVGMVITLKSDGIYLDFEKGVFTTIILPYINIKYGNSEIDNLLKNISKIAIR